MLLFPAHSTLRSIIAAAVRSGNFVSVSDAVACLGDDVPLDGYLGENAEQIGIRFFHAKEAGEILVKNHSHFGLFGNLLSNDDEESFSASVIAGDADALTRARAYRSQGTLESNALRRCPRCVDEDMTAYGVAHWRLYHQWPVAHHCVVHGCELQERCGQCGHQTSRDQTLALPGDACDKCGRREFVAAGWDEMQLYRPTLDFMRAMLARCVPTAKPAARKERAAHARRAKYGLMHLGGLVGLTCAHWGCETISELAGVFGCSDPGDSANLGDIDDVDSLPAMLTIAVMVAASA